MVKTGIAVVLIAVVAGAAGFALGRRGTHTATEQSREPSPTLRPSVLAVPEHPTPAAPRLSLVEAMQNAERDAPQAEASLPGCVQQLHAVRQLVKDEVTARLDKEGTPIPARPTPPAPRFASTTVSSALQAAFASTKIPGSLDGVDCSEYPCIVFGRIRGAEDQMPKLEHAQSMAAYEEDIMTVLLWSATDEEGKEAAEGRHESGEGLEQTLFAVALYPRAEKHQLGDNLDRRIRSRTAELWNGMSPQDETGARPEP